MRTRKNILPLVMAVAMIFGMGAITAFADPAPSGVDSETVAFYGSENSPAISGTNGVALTSDIEIEFSSFTAVDNKGWGTGNWTVDDSDIATQTGLAITVDNDAEKVIISGQPTSSYDGWVYLSAGNDQGVAGKKIALYAVIAAGRDGYEIEINKTVVQGGTVTPPAETFEFEIVSADGSPLNADFGFRWENDNSGAISNKIATNGANTYVGVLTFSTKEGTLVDLLGAGFRIREKAGSTENWTYDNAYYIVEENNEQTTITKVSGQARETVTSVIFTNTYTKSNWAPQNPGRTDDDDDDDDEVYYIITATAHEGGSISPKGKVKVWEYDDQAFDITPKNGYVIDKVLVDGKDVGSVDFYEFENVTRDHTIEAFFRTPSQPDSSKANPDTGAGTPMDYLTYLFHKYVLWFL